MPRWKVRDCFQLRVSRVFAYILSSARNYFLYHFPTRDSLAKWASEVGDESYEFDSFLKYYQKSVDFTQANNTKRAPNASYEYNGSNLPSSPGHPLHVTLPNYANAFASWLLQGFAKIGIPAASDFVSGSLAGAAYGMVTLDPKTMTRSSSESSFWRLALQTTNLVTYQSTLAKRILFDSKKATGVVVDTQGLQYTLSAKREVIVSNGAFHSPQLLMVSGIGPQEILSNLDIDVVQDLPGVGQNMWDHIFFGSSYRVNLLTHSILGNPIAAAEANMEYIQDQTGVVGNYGGDTLAWEKTPLNANLGNATKAALATFPADWPALEYLMLDGYAGDNENYITGSPQTTFQYASVVAALVSPFSRGNVTIASPNTADLPVVNPNWFTDPADQDLAIAAFRRLRQLMATPVMQNITIGAEVFPGPNVTTDAQILDFIRNAAMTVYHAAATCKMGVEGDKMAVVDSRARAFGVEGLRVVDAAAFPFLPPGHPQSTVYALAEKISEDVLLGNSGSVGERTERVSVE